MLINKKALENKDYTSRYTYDSVMTSLGSFVNENAKNDIKILIITDSFGRAVNPYLAINFKEIRYCYDADTAKLTEEYIQNYKPNIVICMYYQNFIIAASAFSFFTNKE